MHRFELLLHQYCYEAPNKSLYAGGEVEVIVVRIWVKIDGEEMATDWGDYQFLTLPRPSERIILNADSDEGHYLLTIEWIFHLPAPMSSEKQSEPVIRIYANAAERTLRAIRRVVE